MVQIVQKFIFVYNPVSGNALVRKRLDKIVAKFQEGKVFLVPYRTSLDNSDFLELVQSVKPDGVIIAGGDGTLSEFVNRLLQGKEDVPVAIFPCGTCNDFATALGINHGNLEEYIQQIIAGQKRRIDVGLIGERYFINVASAGMLTCVAHEVDRKLKTVLGRMAYYLHGLGTMPRFRALNLKIMADGRKKHLKAFFVLLVNSSVVAGFKNLSTQAVLDDGKMELIILKQCSIPELVALIAEIVSGKPLKENKNVVYLPTANCSIACTETLESDIDGDPGPDLPIEIKVLQQRLQIFAPMIDDKI